MTETWLPIPDFPGYDVSDQGRVRSYWKQRGPWVLLMPEPVRILKSQRDPGRYPFIYLHRSGTPTKRYIHQLVAQAFIGPRPDGYEVCHNDGNKENNTPANLRYDTCHANHIDALKHGSFATFQKFTPDEVVDIRELRRQGYSCADIGRAYGVTRVTISTCCLGRSYRHLL